MADARKIKKTGASLLLAPVSGFWDRRTRLLPEAEVGSIRRRPVGGGLGVYESVPDRTVSGNEGKFVGHWGVSADKKRQQCGATSPINTQCFRLLPICDDVWKLARIALPGLAIRA